MHEKKFEPNEVVNFLEVSKAKENEFIKDKGFYF